MRDVDAVIHLAAVVGDPCEQIAPKKTKKVNYLATKMLVNSAKEAGVKNFLFASTCSVYGFKEKLCSEKTKPSPLSLYAESKVLAEYEILATKEITSLVLRLGTVYGYSPRMRFDLVANLLIAKALWDKKMTIYEKSKQFRPFIHVSDVVNALFLVWKNT